MFNCSNLMQHPNENVKSHLTQQPVISNGRFVATFMLDDTTSIGSVATRANTDLFKYFPTFIQVFNICGGRTRFQRGLLLSTLLSVSNNQFVRNRDSISIYSATTV